MFIKHLYMVGFELSSVNMETKDMALPGNMDISKRTDKSQGRQKSKQLQ